MTLLPPLRLGRITTFQSMMNALGYGMGYRLYHRDEPAFRAESKPLLTEFDIHNGLESCELY